MITLAIRLGQLLFKVKRKLQLTLSPQLRQTAAFPSALSAILSGNKLSAVDIGGAVDLQPHWYRMVGNADFHIFEPHPESRAEIEKKYAAHPCANDFHVYPEALSGKGGNRILYATNSPTGSTIVPLNLESAYINKNDSYLFPIKEIPLETLTLDNALAANKVKNADIIKLDIQGAELEVLMSAGAEKLRSLLCFELEVSLNNTFVNGTNLRDLAESAEKNDFEILDVKVARAYVQRNGKAEALLNSFSVGDWDPSVSAKAWEFDVVCFRRPDSLLAKKDVSALRRLIACYCVYGFFLEAAGLALEMQEKGLLAGPESAGIVEAVRGLKASVAIDLCFYRRVLKGLGSRLWGQYMWLHFPTT